MLTLDRAIYVSPENSQALLVEPHLPGVCVNIRIIYDSSQRAEKFIQLRKEICI
jgi:hypothetical protein